MNYMQNLPLSTAPIVCVLHPSDSPKWEFFVGDDKVLSKYGTSIAELRKLPGYPITHKVKPYGILVTLYYGKDKCKSAFHGYNSDNRYGQHIYIGSAFKLLGKSASKEFKQFLEKVFGIKVDKTTTPIPIKLQFQNNNSIHISK